MKTQVVLSGETFYLFDDALIDRHARLARRWLPAEIQPEPILKSEEPWESRALALFGSVFQIGENDYRMYYTDWVPGMWGSREGNPKVMLATSRDGFRWQRAISPKFPWRKHPKTNVVLDSEKRHSDGHTIIYEPNEPIPYRLLRFENDHSTPLWTDECGLYGYESKDGLKWKPVTKGRVLLAGDRTNLAPEKIGGRYVAYSRAPDMMINPGLRVIYRTVSGDFRNWSEPEIVLAPDLQDEPDVEFYGLSSFPRHGWHIGLLEYWQSATDRIEIHLVVSRDSKTWLRTSRSPFIGGIYPWNSAWNSSASSAPLLFNEQMVFYFGGRSVAHNFSSARMEGSIGCASLGLDRFCALEGKNGWFLTKPLIWKGRDLDLNADTRSDFTSHPYLCDGLIIVEVCKPDGTPMKDWSGDNAARIQANTHVRCTIASGKVLWPDNRSLSLLQGQTIRLKLTLRQARLFTLGSSKE